MSRTPTLDDRRQACLRPEAPLAMHQAWRNLLFLHWEVDPSVIESTLPDGLHVDTHEGRAWLGIVPFFMCDIRPRFLPAFSPISNFLEMNVRTYVHDEQGRPGVWFYSLDANRSLAVLIARKCFHLPYHRAEMASASHGDLIDYRCLRRGHEPRDESRFHYGAGDSLPAPEPGSLEYFLVERYLLFAHEPRRDRLSIGRVHHAPYPVTEARVEKWSSAALRVAGFDVGESEPDHALFSPGVEVELFALENAAP